MKIAVIGMGKIGLPLAVQYAKKGHDVIGVDINSHTVDLINKGVEPFPEEKNLKEFLTEVTNNKKLSATLNYEEAVSSSEAIVVVVPLFVNENSQPDFAGMDSATEKIGKFMKKGTLVCYETTLPIGTTRSRFTPILEKQSGLKIGKDFSVVFSPERVFTGRIFDDLKKYPKIVGGVTDICLKKGIHFYNQVLDFDLRSDLPKQNGVWPVESAESAEFVKLAETTYRDVNIALANQFAVHASEIAVNIYEIIEAANSQNYAHIHQPGISVGGHCIPVYPMMYLATDPGASIVQIARQINEEITIQLAQIIKNNISNSKVLILGLAYRSGVKEYYGSGTFKLVEYFQNHHIEAFVYDPLYSDSEIQALGLNAAPKDLGSIPNVVIHTAFQGIDEIITKNLHKWKYVYDGRNALKNINLSVPNKNVQVFGNIKPNRVKLEVIKFEGP